MGQTEFNHGGVALGLALIKDFSQRCRFRLSGGAEVSIPYSSEGPSYNKYSEISDFSCFSNKLGFKVRQFWGKIMADQESGAIPGGVMFFPQSLSGARLRIDSPSLDSRLEIQSYGIDLISSLNLSFLPSTFLYCLVGLE